MCIDRIYELTKPQLMKAVDQDMADLASNSGVAMKRACEALAENAGTVAAQVTFLKAQPAVHASLMASH